ncbi:hypothetical protein [Dictyobacter kobayashii]|nr:hypothetical protein [Dictyobacter kobayashii]
MLEELKTAIQKNLHHLEEVEQNPWLQLAMREKYMLTEKDIGRLCYEAEETLSVADLEQLKGALAMDERRWRFYKAKFLYAPPEKD